MVCSDIVAFTSANPPDTCTFTWDASGVEPGTRPRVTAAVHFSFLDEENRWQLNEQILEKSIQAALAGGTRPVAIVVINPGNPTGAVLSRENIEMIVRFARTHRLSIIADEVYQENVYAAGARFTSFARVMGETGVADITLFSLHSVSKGFLEKVDTVAQPHGHRQQHIDRMGTHM